MASTEMLCASPWRSLTLPSSQAKSTLRVQPSAVVFRCNQSIPLLFKSLSNKDEALVVSLKRQSSTPLVVSQSIPRQNSTWINNHTVDVVDVGKAPESKVDAKSIDVVTLGNLCVDIVKHVQELPPTDEPRRRAYMDAMVARPPPESQWEGGGNCNTAIAAARLGLRCTALGHIGDEVFGSFLRRVLRAEGVAFQEVQEEGTLLGGEDYDGETLLCWVIIHPTDGHTFCSRFDFNKGPAFSRLTEVPPAFGALMSRSKAVFCNGFVYDELPPPTVHAALHKARENGASVFFDPGPRGEAFCKANPYKRECVETLMRLSDVLLMTAEEAETITGIRDQEDAAEALLSRGGAIQWVVIKDGGRGCHMVTHEGRFWLPAYQVDVADTVGCGDSFAAAVTLGFIRGEGPITTLALANAVGAATAMGVGAGRNVAQPDVLDSILSDEAHQQGVVSVRLKTVVKDGAAACWSGGAAMVAEAGVTRKGQARLRSDVGDDGMLGGGLSVGVSLLKDSATGPSAQETCGDRSSGSAGKSHESWSEDSSASASERHENGGQASERLSALEEIKRLQSTTAEIGGKDCVYTMDFRLAAKAAAALLARSKLERSVELVQMNECEDCTPS